MREILDKCRWGAGCVSDARPVLRGCGPSIEQGRNIVAPPGNQAANRENKPPPKLKRPNLLAPGT